MCQKFRDLIVSYSLYRRQLDNICRRKGINNYMTLPSNIRYPPRVNSSELFISVIFSEKMSCLQRSEHYKRRLYHYIYIKYSWDLEQYQSWNQVKRK